MIAAVACDPAVAILLRAALAVLFATAAFHKLRDRGAFAAIVEAYRLVPSEAVGASVLAIAAGEIATATLLLLPSARTLGAAAAIGLLVLYSGAIAINLARGRRTIDCGCGAPGDEQPIDESLLARNTVLVLTALATVPAPAPRALVWVDALTIAGGLAVLTGAWVAAHRLHAAARRLADARLVAEGARP